MTTDAEKQLANALDNLAAQIRSAPRTVVGKEISLTVGPGSSPGEVIGEKIGVTVLPGAKAEKIVGQKIEIVVGPDPATDLLREIGQAAGATRDGKGNRTWIESLVARAKALTDRAVDAGLVAAVQQAIKAAFG